jgi:hypothetical protein
MDLLYVGIIATFFAASLALLRLCSALGGERR